MNRFGTACGVTAALASVALAIGCGGGSSSSPSSPTTPTTPTPPPLNVCGILAGTAFSAQGIVAGTECPPASTPVVKLNLYDKDGIAGGCSGSVIAARAVLTAAHCLVDNIVSVRVFTGSGGQVPSTSFQWSPAYRANDGSSLDVGVVFTGQDIGPTPVALLTSRDAKIGEQAVIAGWGNDATGAGGNALRAGTATISAVGSTQLQTIYTGSGSAVCSGDSGGPIFLSEGGAWAIAGVTSATSIGGSCASGTSYYANIRNAEIKKFILDLVPGAGQR